MGIGIKNGKIMIQPKWTSFKILRLVCQKTMGICSNIAFNKSAFLTFLFASIFFVRSYAQATKKVFLQQLDVSKTYQGKDRPRQIGGRAHLRIANTAYNNGFRTRTPSRLYLSLDGKAVTFNALVGLDASADSTDYAEFYVIGDGKVLWQSGPMERQHKAKNCQVVLEGVKSLLLKVSGKSNFVPVDWVDGLISYNNQPPATCWSPEDMAINRNLPQPASPRINGAMAIGIRPGTPFQYPLAISGKKPFKISVNGLPAGLQYNNKTGIIQGIPAKRGNYYVRLSVKNSAGSADRTLRILVGDTLALTPPMGFLSWNVIQGLISETVIKETADAFVNYGLRDAGYQYIAMDDCWQGRRDAEGKIHPDTVRFPHGLKVISDYLHSKGLKFGIYSSPGPTTCAGYSGTMDHEEKDVQSWVSWGIDYLKYDRCSTPKERAKELYVLMGNLLKQSGRSIVYSLGTGDSGAIWGAEAQAQLWRTAGDIRDQWSLDQQWGIIDCFERQDQFGRFQHPGGWNDPDMLLAGIYGKGASSNDLGAKGCNDIEYQSQMSLWSLLSAPLYFSVDVRNIRPAALKILTNHEVIDVDQDVLGKIPIRYNVSDDQEVWVKEMADGTRAIGLLNLSGSTKKITVNWEDIDLETAQSVRDLWLHKDLGVQNAHFTAVVPGHGVTLIRVHHVLN